MLRIYRQELYTFMKQLTPYIMNATILAARQWLNFALHLEAAVYMYLVSLWPLINVILDILSQYVDLVKMYV